MSWWIKKILQKMNGWIIGATLFVICISISILYFWVDISTSDKIYVSTQDIPKNSVGLLLGTTSRINGQENSFFTYRIQAASDLYKSGKIDCLLVSGDNSTEFYNEAKDMQDALMTQGIPPERIFLDYAGFRTLDSVVRAKEVFGQNALTIVSQSFHAARALVIASHFGIDAIAYAAKDVSWLVGLRTTIREIGSRITLYWDLYLADTSPKFLWEPIKIPVDPTERPVPEKICYPRE